MSNDVPDVPLPWAYGVARNCLANAGRSDRRRTRLAARLAVVDPPREVPAAEAHPAARRTVAPAAPTNPAVVRLKATTDTAKCWRPRR